MHDVSALPVIVGLEHYPDAYDGPAGDALADVLSEVGSERWRQDRQWGGASHDDAHSPADWYGYLYGQLDRLLDCAAGAQPDYRRRLINISALAIAAAQAWDRQHAPTDHPERQPMADAAVFDLSDPAAVLLWVRGAVARLAFPGVGTEAAKRVAPAARLNRLGLAAPAYDELQDAIRTLWGVDVVIPTAARVQDVADAIRDAYARRADAREAAAS